MTKLSAAAPANTHPDTDTALSYTEAYQELQNLVQRLEQASIDVDELSASIKRATQLIDICNQKLQDAEKEVTEVIEGLMRNA